MGPLAGVRIVEVASIGPGPFAAMLLADMGADVVRVERPTPVGPFGLAGAAPGAPPDPVLRGRRSVGVDLKHAEGPEVVLRLVERADALVEGFRPGVAERLGIGPEPCLARNPRLVYGRMTGWGQDGPLAPAAGHDIDYVALSGALHAIGRAGQPPTVPLNLVGDYGGGALFLVAGVLAALIEAGRSGRGQVVDAAMIDGAAALTTVFHGLIARGWWTEERGTNLLDGGAPFYDVYETADGRHVAVGPLEPHFYAELVRLVDVDLDPAAQMDRAGWPAARERLAAAFLTRTRDEWCRLLEGTDACVAPVLSMREAPAHPHHRARRTFTEVAGVVQPAPAPRFSRTPSEIGRPPARPGEHTDDALGDWGFAAAEVARLRETGAVA